MSEDTQLQLINDDSASKTTWIHVIYSLLRGLYIIYSVQQEARLKHFFTFYFHSFILLYFTLL